MKTLAILIALLIPSLAHADVTVDAQGTLQITAVGGDYYTIYANGDDIGVYAIVGGVKRNYYFEGEDVFRVNFVGSPGRDYLWVNIPRPATVVSGGGGGYFYGYPGMHNEFTAAAGEIVGANRADVIHGNPFVLYYQ